jgi:hypothetical protein
VTAILFIILRKSWLGLVMIAWTISMRIPVQPFDAVTAGFFLMAVIGIFFVVERLIIRKGLITVDHWAVGLMLVAGSIILARFLLDRPGSARLGGIGGLRNALNYSVAVPLFFLSSQLAREDNNPRRLFKFLFVVALLMLGWLAGWRIARPGTRPFYFGWYEGAMWFIVPMTLAVLISRSRKAWGTLIPAFIACAVSVTMAVLSPFRSRVYFVVSSIAAVFWGFGYRRRLVMASVLIFSAAIPIVSFIPPDSIPVQMRRALSTIVPYDRGDIRDLRYYGISASGEMGWGSEFRASLAEMAADHIREAPLFGQGWKFTASEMEWAAATFAGRDWAASSLITAGDYHNCIMTIAVKCGLPAAILLSIALIVLFARSIAWSAGIRDRSLQTLYAAMMGVTVSIFGLMLMNGDGTDLQAVCILLGFFHGTRMKVEGERRRIDSVAVVAAKNGRNDASPAH